MFSESATIYDAVYAFKDYASEAEQLDAIIGQHKRAPGNALLDVACGTGGHIAHLRTRYAVEGLDLDAGLLAVARERYPEVPFHEADMLDFALERTFDVITCLFSSIGYVRSEANMRRAIANMARHLGAGGVLVIEPWFKPGEMAATGVYAAFVDQPDLKIARMNIPLYEGDTLSVLDFHYLVATPEGVRHFRERHTLGLFTDDQYQTALRDAGLTVSYDPDGLTGRGLYVGARPAA